MAWSPEGIAIIIAASGTFITTVGGFVLLSIKQIKTDAKLDKVGATVDGQMTEFKAVLLAATEVKAALAEAKGVAKTTQLVSDAKAETAHLQGGIDERAAQDARDAQKAIGAASVSDQVTDAVNTNTKVTKLGTEKMIETIKGLDETLIKSNEDEKGG